MGSKGNLALLALSDGTVMEGISVGATGTKVAELVFNTSMTGYQEILTDPSYASQIVLLTYPHIGNTGCNSYDFESGRAWADGLVMRNVPEQASNWQAEESLQCFLEQQQILAIAEIDTRYLTLKLREKGAMNACLTTELNATDAIRQAKAATSLKGKDLTSLVSTKKNYFFNNSSNRNNHYVIVYDFGVKKNILRLLDERGCLVEVVKADTPPEEVISKNPSGIVLSNGPGDPAACEYAITTIKKLLASKKPLFGICLGAQLLALALGARSYKMKFGHHGANHPVIQLIPSPKVFITSQNHGFAIDETTLPQHIKITHRSLFDDSLQGFKADNLIAFQGHPEGGPGPCDIAYLFDDFINMMQGV